MERYRIVSDQAVYFLAFSVVEWLPVFVTEAACRIITDSLNYCATHKSLATNAFVIMPTHLHMIVFDEAFDAQRLERSLLDFRKFTGRQLVDYCVAHLPTCFTATLRAVAGKDRERRFWQLGRHPEAIYSEAFWRQKLDYLHENPCRKGLVRRAADWRFSSAAYYVSDGTEPSDVRICPLAW